MKKRLFEILDEMNVADGENGTINVGVCGDFVSGDLVKAGGKITMGVPAEQFHSIMNNEAIPVLLVVNKAEYELVRGK